jgi:hypothetical protein
MALEDSLRLNGLNPISAVFENSGIFPALQRNFRALQRNSRGIGRPDRGRRFSPRIVCLTEETVETLYLLGQQHRIDCGRIPGLDPRIKTTGDGDGGQRDS